MFDRVAGVLYCEGCCVDVSVIGHSERCAREWCQPLLGTLVLWARRFCCVKLFCTALLSNMSVLLMLVPFLQLLL